MCIQDIGIRDTGSRDIGFRENGHFGIWRFGILDFGKMDVSGKRPVRENVYSRKCLVREIGIRDNDFGKRYIREN